MEIITLSGLAGSGKTSVLQVLSEEKYTIIESVDLKSFEEIINVLHRNNPDHKVVLVLDYFKLDEFAKKCEIVDNLDKEEFQVTKWYLTCATSKLINRYKELRKVHPFMLIRKDVTLEECINKEREITYNYGMEADVVIDTSNLSLVDLRKLILIGIDKSSSIHLNIASFGFKYGIMNDADFIFDVRFLPNPYYVEDLRHGTGNDKDVYDYVFSFEEANIFYNHCLEMLKLAIIGFKKEGRLNATIAFGCTGGRHRSVSFANRLYDDLKDLYDCGITHIESERGNW